MTVYSGILGDTALGDFALGSIGDTIFQQDISESETVLTYLGETWVSDRLTGTNTDELWLAWGTGDGTSSKDETDIFDQDSDRVFATLSTEVVEGETLFIARATLTAGDDVEITNAGVFNDEVGGDLLLLSVFDTISLNEDDQIVFSFVLNPI